MKELTIDLKNYIESGSVFQRTAVRGVICRDGKYLLIHGRQGDYKFPGGGMEEGESLMDTLLREVKEETGYAVLPDSVREYLLVHERRKGTTADIMVMDSYYYFCDVSAAAGMQQLDPYEQEIGYRAVWLTAEEAVQCMMQKVDFVHAPWTKRELAVMRMLQNEAATPNG